MPDKFKVDLGEWRDISPDFSQRLCVVSGNSSVRLQVLMGEDFLWDARIDGAVVASGLTKQGAQYEAVSVLCDRLHEAARGYEREMEEER